MADPGTKASPRDRLGQFFIFGVPGPKLDIGTRQHILDTKVGSFILFKRNLQNNKQVTELTQELHRLTQEATGLPALVGLDQEGGRVVRIPFSPALPSALAVGQTRDPRLAEALGHQVGVALNQLGFNLNFAPVLDLGTARTYSFLGQRAISSEPEIVSELGVAFAKGHLLASVLPVAKHFPGIGPVPNDPHLSLVRRPISVEDLRARDLKPFQAFTKLNPTGMMISHLIYPKLDPSGLPATFSSTIIQDLLRKDLEYDGLVITDDLMMEGARGSKSFEEDVVRSFRAGADLIMISWSKSRQKQAVAALTRAFDEGKISEAEVLSRLERLDRIKHKVALRKPPRAYNSDVLLVYNFKSYENLVSQIFQKSLQRTTANLPPLHLEKLFVLREQAPLLKSLAGHDRISQASLEKINPALKANSDAYWVLFIRDRAEDQMALTIPTSLRSQILLINLWRPDLKSGSFPNQIDVFMSHPQRDRWIASWINEKLKETPTQAQLVQ